VFYVGHVEESSLYENLFHCNILSKYHHYVSEDLQGNINPSSYRYAQINQHMGGNEADGSGDKNDHVCTPRRNPQNGGKGGVNPGMVPTTNVPKGSMGHGNIGGTFPIPLTNSDRTTMSQINARKRLQTNSIKIKDNPRRVYDYSKGINGEDEVKGN
jgi:hypothetical protein